MNELRDFQSIAEQMEQQARSANPDRDSIAALIRRHCANMDGLPLPILRQWPPHALAKLVQFNRRIEAAIRDIKARVIRGQ